MPAALFETDANPAPHGIRAEIFAARDGVKLRYAVLEPERRAHGTVLILQGRNEFIEKYFETMADLAARGFTVVSFDWRGQGGSDRLLRDRLRGYVRSFDDYCDELDQFLSAVVLPDCPAPFYVLAHSAGGLVALAAMDRLAARVTRAVLCAPLLGLGGQKLGDDAMRRIVSTLRRLGLGRVYAAGGKRLTARPFAGNPLTSDPGRFMRNADMARSHPDLALGGPTVRWVWGALEAARRVSQPDFVPAVPLLIVAAGDDRVVSTAAIERFAARTRNVSLTVIDGARHEMLQEADFYRDQLLAAFDAFIPGSADAEAMPPALEPDGPALAD